MTKLEILRLLLELVEGSHVTMRLHTGIQKDTLDYRLLVKSITAAMQVDSSGTPPDTPERP